MSNFFPVTGWVRPGRSGWKRNLFIYYFRIATDMEREPDHNYVENILSGDDEEEYLWFQIETDKYLEYEDPDII